jgi:transcriptional regulator with XRE-family HTH domain
MPRLGLVEEHQLQDLILSLAGQGMTTRQIAAAITAERGVEIEFSTVSRWLRGVREERAETGKALVQAYLRREVPADLAQLEDLRDQLNGWRLDDRLRISEKVVVIRELRKTIELRLRFAGAAEGDRLPEFRDMTDEELDAIIYGDGLDDTAQF